MPVPTFTTYPEQINTLENAKFGIDVDGKIFIRTEAKGTFSPTGLKNGFKTTTFNVTDTQIALPATAYSLRNAIVITNLSTVDTLYIGESGVTADQSIGITAGHEVGPNESFNLDVTSAVILYGIAETGKTIKVKVTEIG